MITLQVNNVFTDIFGDLPSPLYDGLEKAMSFRPEGYAFSPMFNKWIYNSEGKRVRRYWDGWKRLCWKNKKRTYFPTGLCSIATAFLKDCGIPFKVIDSRIKPISNISLELSPAVKSRDYQIDAVNASCNKQRGIVVLPTGSGKTIIYAQIIQKLGVTPFIVFVTSIDLLLQSKEALETALLQNGIPLKVGQIGAGTVDIADINVVTVQTAVRALGKKWDKNTKFDADDTDDDTPIEKYREQIQNLFANARGAVADEAQHWRAETCVLVSRSLPNAFYLYGGSATPWRDEGDDLLIQSCFGRNVVELTASELIQKGWLIKPNIYMVHIKGTKSKYTNWQNIYEDRVVSNESYNNIIANIANTYIQQGRLVLVLAQRVKHCKLLSDLIPGSLFLYGDSPKKKREEGIKKLRNRNVSCIVSSIIFDEGVNIAALDTLILAGQGRSKVRAMQRIGRILRPFPGKEKAIAVDFCIHDKYLKQHAEHRKKMYMTEPEFVVQDIHPEID